MARNVGIEMAEAGLVVVDVEPNPGQHACQMMRGFCEHVATCLYGFRSNIKDPKKSRSKIHSYQVFTSLSFVEASGLKS